jgi:plastocyanin
MILNHLRAGLLVASVALSTCVVAWSASAAENASSTVVLAKDFMFAPNTVNVVAGSTVTWTNHDDEPHTVVSDTGLFRSGALDTNESFSFTFDKPGTYRFICSIHPQMVGTVVVQ